MKTQNLQNIKKLAKAIENTQKGSGIVLALPTDRKTPILDTYQKKGNWRLFSSNGNIIDITSKLASYQKALATDYYTPLAKKLDAIEAKEKSKASKAASKVKAENFPKRRSAIDLMENARLYEKTVYSSNAYFCLEIEIALDSHSFAGMKKADSQKKPQKTPLSRWLGGATIDLSNFFYRQFDLPCRSPEVDTRKRASNGVKTIIFRYYFDIENRSDYRQTMENSKQYKKIADDIRQFIKNSKVAI